MLKPEDAGYVKCKFCKTYVKPDATKQVDGETFCKDDDRCVTTARERATAHAKHGTHVEDR